MSKFIRTWMRRSRWAIVAMLLGASLISGVTWWRGRPERYLARAEAVREAIPTRHSRGWPCPRSSRRLASGRCCSGRGSLWSRGGYRTAVRALDQVDPDGPSAADYAFWKGRMLYAAGQPIPAITWLVAALKRRPDDADSLPMAGGRGIRSGQPTDGGVARWRP